MMKLLIIAIHQIFDWKSGSVSFSWLDHSSTRFIAVVFFRSTSCWRQRTPRWLTRWASTEPSGCTPASAPSAPSSSPSAFRKRETRRTNRSQNFLSEKVVVTKVSPASRNRMNSWRMNLADEFLHKLKLKCEICEDNASTKTDRPLVWVWWGLQTSPSWKKT